MNERIKQLQFQAAAQIPPLLEASEWQAEFTKKFAEMLIVKCANIIWDEADKKDSAEINEGGYKILDYFGIDWRAEQTEETVGVDGMSTEDKKTLIKELLGVKND